MKSKNKKPTPPAPVRADPVLPAAWFRINQVVATPATVCESKEARIVGVEWGPLHGRARTDCSGWLYWLVEVGQLGEAWAAGESELLKWKGQP